MNRRRERRARVERVLGDAVRESRELGADAEELKRITPPAVFAESRREDSGAQAAGAVASQNNRNSSSTQ